MMTWPTYRVEFLHGPTVHIAAAGLGSAIVDAIVAASETWLPEEMSHKWTTADISSVTQTGEVYISPSAENKLDVLDLIEGREHGSN